MPSPPARRVLDVSAWREALEHVRQELGRDARRRCRAPRAGRGRRPARTDGLDGAALRRELDGVRQQVRQHLLQPAGVALHARSPGARTPCAGRCFFARRGRPRDLDRGVNDVDEVHRVALDAQLPADAARGVEDVVDQPRLVLDVALDRLVARSTSSASSGRVLASRWPQPRSALSGERSSCETMARNSSFARLARSASSRSRCSVDEQLLELALGALAVGDVGGDADQPDDPALLVAQRRLRREIGPRRRAREHLLDRQRPARFDDRRGRVRPSRARPRVRWRARGSCARSRRSRPGRSASRYAGVHHQQAPGQVLGEDEVGRCSR